ncbi:MAG: ABC transporter permease [Chitinophagaceae bacterium]|nr:ABC transporter permease [Chitinophagaceae bacterium]
MFKNYFKTAWRNIIRNKAYSTINIAGLAVGMAVAMLIGLWMYDELSANKHFKNYDSLYQVIMHQSNEGEISTSWVTPFALGDELKSKYSDIKATAMCDGGGTHLLENGDKKLSKFGFFIGEDAVKMFSLDILDGDKNPLYDPYSIVLTDETAKTLFNTTNAVGKIIKLDNAHNLTVKAVVAKQPKNSSIAFDYLLPWQLQESIYPDTKKHKNEWGNNSWQTFVQLNDNATAGNVDAKIKDVVLNHFPDDKTMQAAKPQIELFPISKWRLYTDFENGKNAGGYIKYVRLFGILGFVVLLIACINFMNLSTARSSKRAKEIGIRKVVGSLRKQLVAQFFSESILIAVIAFLLSLIIVFFVLPYFNKLTDKNMSLFITNPLFWSVIVAFILLTGLTAGSYPALYLSSFNPVKVLKGKSNSGGGSALPRKILVVIQFASAVVLMVGTIIIYQQIQHGKDRPVGYNKNGLLTVNYSSDMNKNFDALQNDLIATGTVYSICKSNSSATDICCSQNGWEWQGSKPTDKTTGINTIATEYNFTKTFGIKMIAGRDFSNGYATDSTAVLLNQSAVKLMRLKNPVGEIIKHNGQNITVIGVVPDLQMQSPFQSVAPLIIRFASDWVNALIVRVNSSVSMSKAINTIKPIFEKYNSQFDFQFADEAYAKKFNYEELVANLAAIITIIAIFISCLGLFGLASYMAEQRTKEIGVRRVLGASVPYIWQLLSKDFVVLVLIACAIAVPVAWYLMNNWLSSYEYKINIGVGVFALVIVASVVITLLTVSFQAIKAALANPVKSLRTE